MNSLKQTLDVMLYAEYGKSIETAEKRELYTALSKALMAFLAPKWEKSRAAYAAGKQAYYFSAEFLMGRVLGNAILNLRQEEAVAAVLDELDVTLNALEEMEADAGLGNGGLGRLAACFLDSAATMHLPVHGYGIRYDYGIFEQIFEDGFQKERADHWLAYGDAWSIRRDAEARVVHFEDGDVRAVPYDTPIIGYGTDNINTLRLWKAEPTEPFDFEAFNDQDYDAAVVEKNRAEDISRVLYPNDSTDEGKILRLKQQYFFVSASLQELVARFKSAQGTNFEQFPKYVAIQLNDTHPVVGIPELMRIFIDEEGMRFDQAWEIVTRTFAYTNHTVLSEALEKWDVAFFKTLLPRVYDMIEQVDAHLAHMLSERGIAGDHMRIIQDKSVHMAYLAIYGSHAVNGVAALHTEILKRDVLKDWYAVYPERFQNKTNGITQRRWLALANPELSQLITECLGNDAWVTDLNRLKGLRAFAEEDAVLTRFMDIKHRMKRRLADEILRVEGIEIDPSALFDIQIKRMHEYKRQLLNAFQILNMYFDIKENPQAEVVPRVFIFGGKAAPGYFRAKAVIKYIHSIAEHIHTDPDVKGRIKVVFVTNYRVSYAEKLFPAADISEQISTAGKEASGTGNMKFMLNGTPTIGTLDGANVEIVEEAGLENNFIFGARVETLEAVASSYDPKALYEGHPRLKRIVDTLVDGTFDDGGTGMFKELYDALLEGASWHPADVYYLLLDFDSYVAAQKKVSRAFCDKRHWARMSWMNLAGAGKFSSDRTIMDYAEDIWGISRVEVPSVSGV